MAFKFVALATLLACANAGLLPASPAVGLTSYASSPLSIGSTHQSVLRSYGGDASVSHYSKAEDSAFASVRKYDTRYTNDAYSVAPVATYAHAAPVATYAHAAPVATYAHAAPVAYAQQAYTKVATPVAYAQPAYAKYAASVATYAHAAPVAYAQPAQLAYAQPAYAKIAAPVATYAHAAPVAYAQPAYAKIATPVATYAHASPVAAAYAQPAYAHSAYAAGPVVAKAAIHYSPAVEVSHATFSGLGASYQW